MDRFNLYNLLRSAKDDKSFSVIMQGVEISLIDLINFLLIDVATFLEDLKHCKKIPSDLELVNNIVTEVAHLLGQTLSEMIKSKIEYNLQYILANTEV